MFDSLAVPEEDHDERSHHQYNDENQKRHSHSETNLASPLVLTAATCECIYRRLWLQSWVGNRAFYYANIHQSHSQNDSEDLRGVAGGDGELGGLCCKAGTSHLCDGSAHSSGCVVNGSNAMAAY